MTSVPAVEGGAGYWHHDPFGRTALRAVVASISVSLAGVLPLFLTGALAVQVGRDLGFGAAGVGLLSACYAGVAMLASAPLGGRVGDIGVRRSLRIGAAVGAIALLIGAAAPNVFLLGVAMAVGGLANAIAQPAGNATIAQHVPARRFGIGFAVKQSGIPAATLLAGLAVPTVALTVGWRWAYLAAAGLALLSMAAPPPDRPIANRRDEGKIPPNLRRPAWFLAAALVLAVIAAPSIAAFGALGGVEIGLAESTAGLLVAAGGFLGLTVRILSGLVADRRTGGALLGVAGLMALGSIGWTLMSIGVPWGFVAGLLMANAFGWGWPGLLHLSVARRFPTATAAASGVTQTGVSAGLLIGPLLLGAIIPTLGWSAAWLIAAACALLAAVGVTWSRSQLLRQDQTQ